MLRELHIRHFAVVESLDLEFAPGMTVFTGETGAGKSIIVDAVGLLLGDRADSSVVRNEESQTEISGVFCIENNDSARQLLKEFEIEPDNNEVIIRRVIHHEGRSRGFINGTPATVQQLKILGESLLELHGQHSHQTLLKSTMHRQLLDNNGDYNDLLQTSQSLFHRLSEIRENISALSGDNGDRQARESLLQYQVDELEELDPREHEFEKVEARFRQLSHINQIIETVETAHSALCTDDQSALSLCIKHINRLSAIQKQDERLSSVIELVNNAQIQLEEANDELRDYLEQLDTDPKSLLETEQRMNRIIDTARKHHVAPEQLYLHSRELKKELASIKNSAGLHAEQLQQEQQTWQQYSENALLLSKSRKKAAKLLAKAIISQLHQLGMPAAQLEIRVDFDAERQASQFGLDQIEFVFSANPGQPMQALQKVASGGELSRISLAIQIATNRELSANSLIFDEVDSGIGGATAEVVGKLLHTLSHDYQVFCVTHLAQVAAFGTEHFHVSKMAGKHVTRTQVRKLSDTNRVEEIARMMGGSKITDQSLAHAREMLEVKGEG